MSDAFSTLSRTIGPIRGRSVTRSASRKRSLPLRAPSTLASALAGDDKLKQKFLSAGLRGGNKMDVYLTSRFLVPLAGIAAGSFMPSNPFTWCLAGGF